MATQPELPEFSLRKNAKTLYYRQLAIVMELFALTETTETVSKDWLQ